MTRRGDVVIINSDSDSDSYRTGSGKSDVSCVFDVGLDLVFP